MDFHDCLIECCQNDELVKQFNRLSNTTLSFKDKRAPIEKMIDDATGYNNPFKNKSEEMQQFISFCLECVWLPFIYSVK
jgi:hypothetical protein